MKAMLIIILTLTNGDIQTTHINFPSVESCERVQALADAFYQEQAVRDFAIDCYRL